MLVKAANWLTHLEYEWRQPGLEALARVLLGALPLRALRRARLRHERVAAEELSLDQWTADLEAVIDAAQPEGPVIAARHLTRRGGLRALRDRSSRARRGA